LLCARLMGWRALCITGPGRDLGLYEFGAAAHLLVQVAVSRGRSVFAFTRPGDRTAQAFARSLGAASAGRRTRSRRVPRMRPYALPDVASRPPLALRAVRKGARVDCAGIRLSAIPGVACRLLRAE
jgi:propanol-preferring alcohol dehydrogenase